MSSHDRIRRRQYLSQADGYLELGMPAHALEALERIAVENAPEHVWFLKGQCLRELGRFHEAIEALHRAAQHHPDDVGVWLSLGWCYKRTGRLDLAIESLEEALALKPRDALVHYNLACYWSLAHNKRHALNYLARAFEMEEDYRSLVGSESDFDAIRDDPAFQALLRVTV